MSTKTDGFLSLLKKFACRREPGNVHDPYAVAVTKIVVLHVGHVPWKVSAMRSLFLRQTPVALQDQDKTPHI